VPVNDPMTPAPARWRKSSFSSAGNCVEVSELSDGSIGMRNSKRPLDAVAVFTRSEIDAFLQGVKAGEFDDLG
jgi:hypothetical protein